MIGAIVFGLIQIATAEAPVQPGIPDSLPAAAVAADQDESNLVVYLLTMGPGDQVWEKFGHNAIWIRDAATGRDVVYHWGLFDFADKEFVPRFIQGRMRYSMGAFDMEQTIEAYRQANRTVWAQELNLDPAQEQKLAEFVAWNAQPANRDYDYDYYRDNCSTRVRDAIDNALGGVIRNASVEVPTGTTYRSHTSRLTQDDFAVFSGTMIGLGQPVDQRISAWEEMFLPVRMKEQLKKIRVMTPSGSEPLVKSERVVFQATRPGEEISVNRGIGGYLAISAVILFLGALLWLLPIGSGRKTGPLVLAVIWSTVAGVAGTLLAFLWGFTDHLYSYRNENLLQLNPVSLLLAILLVRLIWRRRKSVDASAGSRKTSYRVALVIAAASFAGFVLQILPGMDQVNAGVIALALPLHAGTLALIFALDRKPGSAT